MKGDVIASGIIIATMLSAIVTYLTINNITIAVYLGIFVLVVFGMVFLILIRTRRTNKKQRTTF